jgi:guanine nucleotide-binding protein subunit alpha
MMGGVGMLTDEHRRTIMRLSPLRQIEQVLTQKFKPLPMGNGPHISGPSTRPGSSHVGSSGLAPSRSLQELHVNGYAWQRARARSRLTKESHNKSKAKGQDAAVDQIEDNEIGGWEDENLEKVLYACKDDMVKLWQDPVVRAILKEYRIGLEELSN